MIHQIQLIATEILEQIDHLADLAAWEQLRIKVLGKKGTFTELLKSLGSCAPDDRPLKGRILHDWEKQIHLAFESKKKILSEKAFKQDLAQNKIDVTLPGRIPHRGSLHPLTQTTQKIVGILTRLGFQIALGPEIETEYVNFEAMNMPADHASRDMQDTFYLSPGILLRTHTSCVQVRSLREKGVPIRILSPGAVYRADLDATHSPMFHQIEGLWVDTQVRMSDLKGVLEFLAQELFGTQTRIRLRPSYFPFVEPGAEVDVSCFLCPSSSAAVASCRICKGTGWLEILGAGMVHPVVLKEAGCQDSGMRGFAMGMGVERIAQLLYQIPDLRLFFQNDIRFLSQF